MNNVPCTPQRIPPVGQSDPYAPPPAPGSYARPLSPEEFQCRASRVLSSGGALNTVLTNPDDVSPFEQLFRRLPEQGIHSPTISPNSPFIFPLGSFIVPREQALVLFDLRPDIYRFSGLDPNDTMPVENRRFASQVGYEVTIDGLHPGNLRMELEPLPRQQVEPQLGTDIAENPQTFPPNNVYVQAQANRFGGPSGAGLSLLPQRPFRYGPESLPLTLMLTENQIFEAKAVIFKPIQAPIAFFEWDMAGALVPLNSFRDVIACMGLRR